MHSYQNNQMLHEASQSLCGLKQALLDDLDRQCWKNNTLVQNPNTPEPKVQQVNPAEFVQARSKTRRPQFLTPYIEQQLSEFELYLVGQDVGYALTPKKDLVNVFNNSGVSGAGVEAVIDAISREAKTLNCYSDYLCDYYKQFGFTETKREKWNDKYAPENWDLNKYGRPDIVFMEYTEVRDATRLKLQVWGQKIQRRRTVNQYLSSGLRQHCLC